MAKRTFEIIPNTIAGATEGVLTLAKKALAAAGFRYIAEGYSETHPDGLRSILVKTDLEGASRALAIVSELGLCAYTLAQRRKGFRGRWIGTAALLEGKPVREREPPFYGPTYYDPSHR